MEKYIDFFRQLNIFKAAQDGQRRRGLNNYNILTSVLDKHDEVRLHSRMIFSFLDPGGEHYQGDLFLDNFLFIIGAYDLGINLKECQVYKEYRNIDLYITDGRKHIIIENKIKAKDQERQIESYLDLIMEGDERLEKNDVLVVYLSLDRSKPSKYSLGNLKIKENFLCRGSISLCGFRSIHYENEIINWLTKCQYEVQNITNLNEVFDQYIDVVRMINNSYKEKVMSLADFLKDNPDLFNMAVEIKQALPGAKKLIVDEFFLRVKDVLELKLGKDWCVEICGDFSQKYGHPLIIYKHGWRIGKKPRVIFCFEFDMLDYYLGYFGVSSRNCKVDMNNDLASELVEEVKNIGVKINTTESWLYWSWTPKYNRNQDLAEYIMENSKPEEEFIRTIMPIIEKFEMNSGIMSRINAYFNNKT